MFKYITKEDIKNDLKVINKCASSNFQFFFLHVFLKRLIGKNMQRKTKKREKRKRMKIIISILKKYWCWKNIGSIIVEIAKIKNYQ